MLVFELGQIITSAIGVGNDEDRIGLVLNLKLRRKVGSDRLVLVNVSFGFR